MKENSSWVTYSYRRKKNMRCLLAGSVLVLCILVGILVVGDNKDLHSDKTAVPNPTPLDKEFEAPPQTPVQNEVTPSDPLTGQDLNEQNSQGQMGTGQPPLKGIDLSIPVTGFSDYIFSVYGGLLYAESELDQSRDFSMETRQKSYGLQSGTMRLLISNHSDADIQISEQYQLEEQTGDEWKRVPFRSEISFTDGDTILLRAGKTEPQFIRPSDLAEPLHKGTYRIVKKVDGNPISCTFQIV